MSLLTPLTPPQPQKTGDKIRFGNLAGSSLPLVIAELAQQSQKPLLVITVDNLSAQRLERAIHFFTPELALLNFPDWETLPYDNFSPHQDIVSDRLLALSQLPALEKGILIVPITTLIQRLPTRAFVEGNTFAFACGDKVDLTEMRRRLERSGYRLVSQVVEHGEFAVRGSILDLFPTGANTPYRLDFFGDEIDSIRTFDPETQRTIDKIDNISLLPAREFPLTDEDITRFRQHWREKFAGDPSQSPIYQDVSQGMCPAGIEYYLPLFFNHTETLLDYLPSGCNVLHVGNIHDNAENFWHEINERYEQLRYDILRPILEPQSLYLPINELFNLLNNFSQIYVQVEKLDGGQTDRALSPGKFNFATSTLPDITVNSKAAQPLQGLNDLISSTTASILLCAETAGRREVLLDLLKSINVTPVAVADWASFLIEKPRVAITISPLEECLNLQEPSIIVITESQLFGRQVMQRRRRKIKSFDSDAVVRSLAELTIGSPVVHIDHGIGRYTGLQILDIDNIPTEFVTLEYANNDKLYVPVSSLHLISRYTGVDSEHAPLHRLGSEQWDKAKRKSAEQVSDVAAELLDIYARRAARKGHAFRTPDAQYSQFAAAFPFEETPDQQIAIDNVIADMKSQQPMDRLVCGDVGFGKTEVAMRAAFVAVQDGKQVAMLVPTTLLAEQHYQNFKDRFADWPVNIEVISRFRSAKQQTEILDKITEGKVDILIGTHKLIQKDVKFKNLGLLLIDEEHRFGVQQKEKLKALRSEVDILALTATPIPRTLNMAFSGLRELSIIATPPARRLSIKTFVREYNGPLIREAIMRELLRGGQIYYLYNEVQSIGRVAEELAALIPEARVNFAHGQMHERELEKIMADFYHQRFNILIATTIIESGIDVPTANTIIINRADKFGLAQLHQLRGRVGRSHHQAYAYLLTPPKKSMTSDAIKRLDAISSLEDLGAGFTLATHDLEIRGAGELLGEEQSGNIQAIGFTLYMELLDHAVKCLKSSKQPDLLKPLNTGSEIDLRIPAIIPNDYLPDVHNRLIFYKRIANAADTDALQELQAEMIDRFGLLPPSVKNLFQTTEIKLAAQKLGIKKIDAHKTGGRIEFDEKPNVDPAKIIKLIQTKPHTYKLDGPTRLKFSWDEVEPEQRVSEIFNLLERLH